MIFNNKKGIFALAFVLFMIILISYTSYLFYISERSSLYTPVGGKAVEIYSLYQKAEKALLFIDKSAEYSFDKSLIYNKNKLKTDCGTKNGYILLVLGDKTCFLDKEVLNNNFNDIFNLYISEYLSSYSDLDLKSLKYELNFNNKYIVGKANNKLKVELDNMVYTVDPSFRLKMNFDVEKVFLEASDKVKKLYVLCGSDKNCWDANKGSDTIVQYNGKFFMLDINTGYKFGLLKDELILKFGLDFETNPLFR